MNRLSVLILLISSCTTALYSVSTKDIIRDGIIKRTSFFVPNEDEPTYAEQLLIDLIEKEKKSIKVSVYAISHRTVIRALVSALHRNVNVEIITETSTYDEFKRACKRDKSVVETIDEGRETTLADYAYVYDVERSLMHTKFIIFEQNINALSIIWKGSSNLTYGGLQVNEENNEVDSDPREVALYQARFEKIKKRCKKPSYTYNIQQPAKIVNPSTPPPPPTMYELLEEQEIEQQEAEQLSPESSPAIKRVATPPVAAKASPATKKKKKAKRKEVPAPSPSVSPEVLQAAKATREHDTRIAQAVNDFKMPFYPLQKGLSAQKKATAEKIEINKKSELRRLREDINKVTNPTLKKELLKELEQHENIITVYTFRDNKNVAKKEPTGKFNIYKGYLEESKQLKAQLASGTRVLELKIANPEAIEVLLPCLKLIYALRSPEEQDELTAELFEYFNDLSAIQLTMVAELAVYLDISALLKPLRDYLQLFIFISATKEPQEAPLKIARSIAFQSESIKRDVEETLASLPEKDRPYGVINHELPTTKASALTIIHALKMAYILGTYNKDNPEYQDYYKQFLILVSSPQERAFFKYFIQEFEIPTLQKLFAEWEHKQQTSA